MKRREADRAGGVVIEDLMLKCKEKVVKTDNMTLNVGVNVVLICSNDWLDCQ